MNKRRSVVLDHVWQVALPTPLAVGHVHVWKAVLHNDSLNLETLQRLLSDEEIDRAYRFHHMRDRHRFIAARGQLRLLLSHYLDQPPQTIRFDYNIFGKPFVPEAKGLAFNLAHAGSMALYAFACHTEIGVDVEDLKADFPVADIARHYFSPVEIDVLRKLPHHLQTIAFFNCWTRKEAYIKARGEGLSIPLDSFDVSLAPGEPARLLAIRDYPTQAAEWSLVDLQPGNGYVGALVVRGGYWQVSLWDGLSFMPHVLDIAQRSR
jgi:4'-phosphopantetheinyl transferase